MVTDESDRRPREEATLERKKDGQLAIHDYDRCSKKSSALRGKSGARAGVIRNAGR
jgi:hypothetical protein